MPLGINVAATSLVGQSLGSWQTEEARRRGNMATMLGVGVITLLATPIVIFAPAILRLFDPSAHPIVQSAGTAYMRINTIMLPFTAVAMVANGALRGAGDSVPGMLSTMLTRGMIAVFLSYLLAFPLGMGSLGVWYALAIGTILDAVFMGIRWAGRAWLRIALHKTALYRQHLRHLTEGVQQQYLQNIRTPFMAQPTAREFVEDGQVIYILAEKEVRVSFDKGGYQVA